MARIRFYKGCFGTVLPDHDQGCALQETFVSQLFDDGSLCVDRIVRVTTSLTAAARPIIRNGQHFPTGRQDNRNVVMRCMGRLTNMDRLQNRLDKLLGYARHLGYCA